MNHEVQEYPTSKYMHCKLGSTASQRVRINLKYKRIKVGEKIMLKRLDDYQKDYHFKEFRVTKIYENGFFFADL